MAKRRLHPPVKAGPLNGRHEGRLFARSASVWQAIGAPECMWDDAVAVACYDRWIPGSGLSRLRLALQGRLIPAPNIEKMKADYLRHIAAPRLLWAADALDAQERAVLVKDPQWLELTRRPSKAAPDWLTERPPWRVGAAI